MSASAPITSASPSQPWTCIPLTTTAQRAPGGLVLHVSGELDLDSAPTLEAAATAHLGTFPSVLILDLSRITFIDCAGLGALLRISVHTSCSRTALLLGPISPYVARLIALTGDAFRTRPSTPTALARSGRHPGTNRALIETFSGNH
jgi:anti-anti-sigma factor